MFEQIFGSKTRVKLMKLFLENPEKKFYVRQMTRETDCLINSVRRELQNLLEIGFVEEVTEAVRKKAKELEQQSDSPLSGAEQKKKAVEKMKKYYMLNKYNIFRNELENLFSKGKVLMEKKFGERLLEVGSVRYLALSGLFVNQKNMATDIVVVGDFDKSEMQNAIKNFEKEIKKEIRYTLIDSREYRLRKDIADRFLNDIINNEHNLVILDELKLIDQI